MGFLNRPKGGDIETYREANEQFTKADRDAQRTSTLISAQEHAHRTVTDLKVVQATDAEQG